MKDALFKILGGLASKLYQEKYIVCGNADEYVLPDELLEDAKNIVARTLRDPNGSRLNSNKINALKSLLSSIERNERQLDLGTATIDKKELVMNDPLWSSIRNEAIKCFEALNLELRDWERINIGP